MMPEKRRFVGIMRGDFEPLCIMNLQFRVNPMPKKQDLPVRVDSSRTVNMNTCNVFFIKDFKLNTILEIFHIDHERKYLSVNANSTDVVFDKEEDGSGRQKWIIENDSYDPTICYIKTVFYHKMRVQYIGIPNQSGLAYLYTSKNKYTQWKIQHLGEKKYQFSYIGKKFVRSEVELVVARFRECIDWVMAYNDIAVVYNKGNPVTGFNRSVDIENVGREGHTYLYHIKLNYSCLAQKTIFTQADPFQHNPTILFGIDNHFQFEPLQPLGLRYLKQCNLPPFEYIEKNKTTTNYGLEYLTNAANGDLICDGFHDVGIVEIRKDADKQYPEYRTRPLVDGFLRRSGFPIGKFPNQIKFTFCGIFAVCCKRILYYPLEVYANLLNELVRKDSQGGINGYILEKTWLYIFDNPGL